MTENDIRKYARLMKELELSGIEINESQGTFRLERKHTPAALPAAPEQTAIPAAEPAAEERVNDESFLSPMVGMFYTAPAENAEAYVHVGDAVRRGQTLCIIESMKLMNEVVAEKDGVITAICAENGQLVEYGTELFRIKEAQA